MGKPLGKGVRRIVNINKKEISFSSAELNVNQDPSEGRSVLAFRDFFAGTAAGVGLRMPDDRKPFVLVLKLGVVFVVRGVVS